jgi:hypothetical protein
MILCCGKGGQLSFTDQILKDPKTAAENTIKILEEKGYEEGMKSLEKALANLFLIPENKKALDKVYGWADELRKLAAQSTNTDIKTKLMTDWEALADELDFCRKVADSVAADPRPAAANAMRILENGYDRGKAWIERGFAAVDPKTPAGIAWAKKHGKNFAEFTAGLRANVDGWDKDKLTHIQQEIAQKLPGDLEKIMAPFVAAMKAERE